MSAFLKTFLILLSGLVFLLPFHGPGFQGEQQPEPRDSVQRLTLLFAGDAMQHQQQIDVAYDAALNRYNYDSCYNYVRDLVSSYDIAVANLEVTLGGAPYSGYPQFSAPDEFAQALKNAGFDILVTANNHSCDRGRKGIERTVRVLDSLGIPHTGTFKNAAERDSKYPLIITKNGIRIALLNYTYGTNGIAVPEAGMVNLIDTAVIAADLKQASDSLPDKIIVCNHWGDEYQLHPNQWQESMAAFCFAHGADIVIGSHPHVLQRMERFNYPDSTGKEVLLVYSLGNYISSQRTKPRDGGASIGFELIKKNGQTTIGLTGYYLTWVWIPTVNGRKQYYIIPASRYAEDSVLMDESSRGEMKIFTNTGRDLYGRENKRVGEFTFDPARKQWTFPASLKD